MVECQWTQAEFANFGITEEKKPKLIPSINKYYLSMGWVWFKIKHTEKEQFIQRVN